MRLVCRKSLALALTEAFPAVLPIAPPIAHPIVLPAPPFAIPDSIHATLVVKPYLAALTALLALPSHPALPNYRS